VSGIVDKLLDAQTGLHAAADAAPASSSSDAPAPPSAEVLAEETAFLRHLCQQGLLKRLGKRVIDPSFSVRTMAVGVLRNISLVHGPFCQMIYKSDCLLPLLSSFRDAQQYLLRLPESSAGEAAAVPLEAPAASSSDVNSGSSGSATIQAGAKISRGDLQAFLLQVAELLCNLIEECPPATETLTAHKFATLALPLLKLPEVARELAHSVGMLLCTLTENNAECADNILNHASSCRLLAEVLRTTEPATAKLRAIAACIMWNCHKIPTSTAATLTTILPVLRTLLNFDALAALRDLAPLVKEWHARKSAYLEDRRGRTGTSGIIDDHDGEFGGSPVHADDGHHHDDDDDDDDEIDDEAPSSRDIAAGDDHAASSGLPGEEEEDGDPVILGETSILEEIQGLSQSKRRSAEPFRAIDTQVKTGLRIWMWQIEATQVALEVLTNVVSGDCYETEDANWEEQADEEGLHDSGLAGAGDERLHAGVPRFVIEEILSVGILSGSLQALCQFPAPDTLNTAMEATKEPRIGRLFEVLQARALTLLANLFLALDLPDLGEPKKYWDFLCQLCGTAFSLRSLPVLPPITNSMWALLRKSQQEQTAFRLTQEQCKGILNLCNFKLSAAVRMNAAGILGIIGQHAEFAGILPTIASALFTGLVDEDPLVVVEAANSIFDLFAEPDHNELCQRLGMPKRLNQLLNTTLPQHIRAAREARDRELFDRLDEVRINLRRFLEYKKNQ
jgi:hypothetical protein